MRWGLRGDEGSGGDGLLEGARVDCLWRRSISGRRVRRVGLVELGDRPRGSFGLGKRGLDPALDGVDISTRASADFGWLC